MAYKQAKISFVLYLERKKYSINELSAVDSLIKNDNITFWMLVPTKVSLDLLDYLEWFKNITKKGEKFLTCCFSESHI
jgi:hypothetical protein